MLRKVLLLVCVGAVCASRRHHHRHRDDENSREGGERQYQLKDCALCLDAWEMVLHNFGQLRIGDHRSDRLPAARRTDTVTKEKACRQICSSEHVMRLNDMSETDRAQLVCNTCVNYIDRWRSITPSEEERTTDSVAMNRALDRLLDENDPNKYELMLSQQFMKELFNGGDDEVERTMKNVMCGRMLMRLKDDCENTVGLVMDDLRRMFKYPNMGGPQLCAMHNMCRFEHKQPSN